MKERINRTTIKDCKVETMKSSGKGGQGRDKRDTAVRVTHEPSGATGFSQDDRSQAQNKRQAFRRMAESPRYKRWVRAAFGEQNHDEIDLGDGMGMYRRSYNFIDNRVVDHFTGRRTAHIQRILDGELELIK